MARPLVVLCLLLAGAAVATTRPENLSPEPLDALTQVPQPCGLGVNMVDLFWRRVTREGRDDPEGVAATRKMLASARKQGVKVIRMAGSQFWPVTLRMWHDESTRDHYWSVLQGTLDDVVEYGDAKVGITIAWNIWGLLDLCSDEGHQEALGRDMMPLQHSCSAQILRTYTTELVQRFHAHPAIAFWELSNELNLAVDLYHDGSTRGCHPSLGTPEHRIRADDFSTDTMIAFMRAWAALVRSLDPKNRPVSTGHSTPRPSALHLRKSFPHRADWTLDSREEFQQVYRDLSVGFELASLHLYPGNNRWGDADHNSVGVLHAAVEALEHLSNSDVYLGEYGNCDGDPGRVFTHNVLQAVSVLPVRLSTLWVWEMQGQIKTCSVYRDRDVDLMHWLASAQAATAAFCAKSSSA